MKIVANLPEAENVAEKIVILNSGNAGELINPDYLVIPADTGRLAIDLLMNLKNNIIINNLRWNKFQGN